MRFVPYGPFDIPKGKNGLIDTRKESLAELWAQVAVTGTDGLPQAVGCYIFAVRAGKGLRPWYVGLAEKQPFQVECFSSHKLNHYNQAIAARKGTPFLTLIARLTPGGNYAKASKTAHRDIRLLEEMLIGACLRRNPRLLNVKDTMLLKQMIVPGLINNPKGRVPSSVTHLRALLGT